VVICAYVGSWLVSCVCVCLGLCVFCGCCLDACGCSGVCVACVCVLVIMCVSVRLRYVRRDVLCVCDFWVCAFESVFLIFCVFVGLCTCLGVTMFLFVFVCVFRVCVCV